MSVYGGTGLDELTPREREVWEEVAKGKTDKEIAEDLCISPKTVGHHVSSLLSKLGVSNRVQAAVLFPG